MLVTCAGAQGQPGANRAKTRPLTKITIAGKAIAGDDLLVHSGTTYVSVSALARVLGGIGGIARPDGRADRSPGIGKRVWRRTCREETF